MLKNKKILLLLIVLFPSVFWLILETSTINSKKLPYYGPRSLNGTDSVFYSIPSLNFNTVTGKIITAKFFDTINYPLLTLAFIKPKYITENYRLSGLLDYTQYKKTDFEHVPLLLIFPERDSSGSSRFNLKDSLKISLNNIEQCYWKQSSYDSINVSFFKQKPSYIDYSFIVLLDKQRHIRGYYDSRYSAEMKRLLQEYKHLRIREEKNNLLRENEIKDEKNK